MAVRGVPTSAKHKASGATQRSVAVRAAQRRTFGCGAAPGLEEHPRLACDAMDEHFATRAFQRLSENRSMQPLKHFIADLRFETQEALATREPRGLIASNIAVSCIPVLCSDGTPSVIYTVNGRRATLGQAARQLKEAAEAAGR